MPLNNPPIVVDLPSEKFLMTHIFQKGKHLNWNKTLIIIFSYFSIFHLIISFFQRNQKIISIWSALEFFLCSLSWSIILIKILQFFAFFGCETNCWGGDTWSILKWIRITHVIHLLGGQCERWVGVARSCKTSVEQEK